MYSYIHVCDVHTVLKGVGSECFLCVAMVWSVDGDHSSFTGTMYGIIYHIFGVNGFCLTWKFLVLCDC